MYYTTLSKIRSNYPCTEGWKNLLASLGKSTADDEPLSLATILEANGVDEAIWALRAVEGIDELSLLFSVRCIREHCQHMITDKVSLDTIDIVELYPTRETTRDYLSGTYNYLKELKSDVMASNKSDASIDATQAIMTLVGGMDVWGVVRDTLECTSRAGANLAAFGSIRREKAAWDDTSSATWRATWRAAWDVSNEDAWIKIEADFKAIFCED